MSTENPDIWQFDEFRLDVRRKVLWHGETTVAMPPKQLDILSMLVRNDGGLVTKDEIIDEIWKDSFVEEGNLSRHIYLLRKTLRELGASEELIENVPRRGYRFTGEARPLDATEIIVEKHTHLRTRIEVKESVNGRSPRRGLSWQMTAVIALVTIVAGSSAYFGARSFGKNASSGRVRSLAVLPFRLLGDSPSRPTAGIGLADMLTTRLSRLRDIKVRPSNAVVGLDTEDVVAAGKKLEVDAVLEGTMYDVNDRVRVTARLVRIADGAIIWSGEFDRLKKDELQLQSELALQIVPALVVNLSPDERDSLAKRYTDDTDAYDLYLKGRYEWNKRSNPGMVEAQRLFRNAIEADPQFALAYVGLADTLLVAESDEGEAADAIAKALELDPNLAEAYASRGFYLMFHRWEWQEAETAFKRSLELNPNYATAHHWYATLLSIKGENEAAKAEMRAALELNPLSYNFTADLGQLYYFSGEYAEAEQLCQKAIEIYPDFSFAHEHLGSIYLKTGQFEMAVREQARSAQINGTFAHDRSKTSDPTEDLLELFREKGIAGPLNLNLPEDPRDPAQFYLRAWVDAFLGNNEHALFYLEKATDERIFMSAFSKADPVFENLRDNPRYKAILKKMGL